MILEGKTGTQILSTGSLAPIRLDESGAIVVVQGHTEHEQMVLGGNTFVGANLGGTPVTTQAGLSATTPALTLYNPIGSGVNLTIVEVNLNITASPAAAAGFMLAYNLPSAAAPTATTLATVSNAVLGRGNLPTGQCYRICTLPAAPLAIKMLGGTTGASAIGGTVIHSCVHGGLIIAPGVALSIQATSAAAIIASISWEEKLI